MKYLSLFFIIAFIAAGCTGQSERDPSFSAEGVEIEGAWARPASEGRMSAAYFLISNFEQESDTLLSVQSDVAQLVEIHESFEQEEGVMGMREVPEIEIPAQSTVRFQQGGLHVMLMRVTRTLADGDTFELTLTFANSEAQTIEVPVRL